MKNALLFFTLTSSLLFGDSTQSMKPGNHAIYALKKNDNPTVLSLHEAISLALRQNENIIVSRTNVEIARSGFRSSWGYFLPKLQVSGELKQNFPEVTLPAAFDPRRQPKVNEDVSQENKDLSVFTPKRQADAVFSASLPIIHASAIVDSQQAHLNLEKARLHFSSTEQNTIISVVEAYFTAFQEYQKLLLSDKQLKRTTAHRNSVLDRFKSGLTKSLDLDEANLQLIRTKQAQKNQREMYSQSLGNLGIMLGLEQSFELRQPEIQNQATQPKLDDLINKALKVRPDFRVQHAAVEAQRKSISKTVLQYLPDITLAGQARYSTNVTLFNDNNWTGSISLKGSWNLYDGGMREAQMRKDQSLLHQAKVQEKYLHDKIVSEVRARFQEHSVKKSQHAIATEALNLAKSIQSETVSQYYAGTRKSLDVIDANVSLFQAEIELDKAQNDVVLSMSKLYQAAGSLGELFASALSNRSR